MAEINVNNMFEENLDDSIPLEELLKDDEPKSENIINKEKNVTPLQQMKSSKDEIGGGIVISNDDLKAGEIKAPSMDMVHTDERIKEWEAALDDMDETTKRRKAVTLVHQPKDQSEYIKMMLEIDSVNFDENGKAYFNYTGPHGKPETPYYVKIREEGDSEFDVETLEAENPENEEKNNEQSKSGDIVSDEEIKKAKTVQILIDKTGLGTDFLFTDEEKEKIQTAEIIKINEVKTLDIKAVRSKRNNVSFQDIVNEYNLSGSKTTICFPASGFRAQMKGLTYGEYADISLSMDNVTFDQYYKRLSIIYNKMTNISTGAFKDFEDFLKHFAYTDISLALYALFVSTEQENQEITLRCGNKTCNRTFNWKYSTRSILRLDRCADKFLSCMEEIATAIPEKYDEIKENAAVNVSHAIELPDSKFVVELGVASAYDFLYNFIPLMNEDTFKEAFGDELNEVYMNNILLLTGVRSVYIPDDKGGYTECLGYKDILDALYNISPEEIKIIAAYVSKFQSEYEVTFSFGNVKCPHCGNITENLDVTMDDLVFQTFQRLMSTEIDLSKIPSF